MSQGPQLSSLLKKKASTILPRTPSPPPNKLSSSQLIIPTSIPPSQEILRRHPAHHTHPALQHAHHTTHHSYPPYNPHNLPIAHIPPHNFTSTFPTLVHHPIPPHPLPPHQPRRRHPFTDFIANTPFPTKWEPFTLERYAGETDQNEHLKVYITHVALYTSHDAVFCKAFPATLKGPALEWFTTLLSYSIDCFNTLSHMFTTHFADNRLHQTTTISLLDVRQEQDEMLRAFIDRFSKAALRTPHLNQEMILQCMTLTHKPGPFANNVYLHPHASMHELKLRAADYFRMEEMQTLHTKFCNDYAPSTATPSPQPPRPNRRPRQLRQPRFTRYAPLNVPRSRLLDEAL